MVMKSFMPDMVLSELEDVVGEDNVSTRESGKLTYGADYFWVSRMWADRGQEPSKADFVVRPDSAEEVSKILRIVNHYKISVYTRGGGSGSQGGVLPIAGGITMDLKRVSQPIGIDEESRTTTAETGMIFQQLEWYANERGYFCMRIPSCFICGTIDGVLAHRGIGIMPTKYGKIDDQYLSMEVVLPNGDIINTLPVLKHAAGPDLNQIFIGSEGTLGVMTKAKFKLFEQPESRELRTFMFPSMKDGTVAGRDVMQKVKPPILRLFSEAETASIIKKIVGVGEKGSFMNLALEGIERIVDIEMEAVIDVCRQHGGRDMGAEYGEKWYENRITFFYPDNIMDVPQMSGTMDTVSDFTHIEEIY